MFIECILKSDDYNDCGGGIVIIRNSGGAGRETVENRAASMWGYLNNKVGGGGYYVLSFNEFKKICKNVIGIESQYVGGLRDIYTKEWDEEKDVVNYKAGWGRNMYDVVLPR